MNDHQAFVHVQCRAGQIASPDKMCRTILEQFDLVATKQHPRADRKRLDHQRIRDHDRVIISLRLEEIIDRRIMRMVTVADDFSVHFAKAQGRADKARLAMMELCHSVVYVRHASCPVCDRICRLFIRSAGMSLACHDILRNKIVKQIVIAVMLAGHRHNLDHIMTCFLVAFELFHIGRDTVLFRLRSLIHLIQIRSFEMNSKDLGAFIAFLSHFRHIGDRLGQNLFALRDRCRKQARDPFLHDIFCPVAQPFRCRVICIPSICPVRMDIDKSRNDPLVAVILVHIFCSIRIKSRDLFVIHFDLSFHPHVQHPDFSALNYHKVMPPSSCLLYHEAEKKALATTSAFRSFP